jgi:serine/threonine protein phosphatase PrpC
MIVHCFIIHLPHLLFRTQQISVRALKGGRVTMEDEYFVAEGGRFVAVFDGHGGGGVSQFLKHHLYDAVCHHLKEKHWEENDAVHHPLVNHINTECAKNSSNAIPSVFSHVAALKAAFSQIEENVLADETLSYQGSTAVAVLLHESEEGHRTLLSANVGDSRAILSRRGRAVDLTRDHKPNEEREKARILAMGETIEWDRISKVHRVRNLSLSRAIGDRYAKPAVSGEVEINHYPVVEDGDEFILLASDGLWDVMTSEDAVAFVHQRIESELASENIAKDDIENYRLVLRRNMAKFVAREAIRRGSCDNVCVLMVWLNDLDNTK